MLLSGIVKTKTGGQETVRDEELLIKNVCYNDDCNSEMNLRSKITYEKKSF